MASATVLAAWRHRPDVTLAALGLASGLLSAGIGLNFELKWLRPLAVIFFLEPGALPIGLFFGAAVAVSLWLATGKAWALPVLPVTTMYAWSAAIQVAIRLQTSTDADLRLIAASLAAGAVGAGITHLGCAFFAPELRRPARIGLTCAVGALAGMLLYMGQRKLIDDWLLFVIWQPAVALCIGVGLRGRLSGHDPPRS
jgi:hypothetical protein